MLGCFNPNVGQIWTNPNVGVKMQLKSLQLKVKVEVGLTQYLGLSIFYPNVGSNYPTLFRVLRYKFTIMRNKVTIMYIIFVSGGNKPQISFYLNDHFTL